ncbi:hypothetical protein CYY_002245 [Polysphondylium violaceum]|uniref:Membrane magnesium transporter n=1 Tax=Polysphondylium violaceum TaxID=133409 RepID=A0A8J4V730_9MYCE|nr:hypothetical protein CYY_002245 [Polysphondylium violaceum]
MKKVIAQFLCFIGVVVFLHTVYSALQHRKYLRLTDQPFERIPNDIVFECIVSLVIFSWGIINTQILTPIKVSTHLAKKSFDSFAYTPNFTVFKNRGQYINSLLNDN